MTEEVGWPNEKEYFVLQDIVTGINKDCLEIKKWSVTTASIAAVVGQVGLKNIVPVLIVIVVLAIGFWITETIWRMNQWAFIRRIRELEDQAGAPGISSGWRRFYVGGTAAATESNYEEGEATFGRAWGHFWAWRTCLPHAFLVLAAAGFLLAHAVGLLALTPDSAGPQPQQIEGKLDVQLRGGRISNSAAPVAAEGMR